MPKKKYTSTKKLEIGKKKYMLVKTEDKVVVSTIGAKSKNVYEGDANGFQIWLKQQK